MIKMRCQEQELSNYCTPGHDKLLYGHHLPLFTGRIFHFRLKKIMFNVSYYESRVPVEY